MSVVTSVIDGGKERKASHVCHSYNVYLSERHRKAEAEFCERTRQAIFSNFEL